MYNIYKGQIYIQTKACIICIIMYYIRNINTLLLSLLELATPSGLSPGLSSGGSTL